MSNPPLPRSVTAWKQRGRLDRVGDHRVFVVQEGAGEGQTPVLFLHGFPTSSYDWHRLWGELHPRPRLALDLPGYGLSDKPEDYSYSLFEQAEVVIEVARRVGLGRCHVVAHDMGTSVLTELLARRERGQALPFEPVSIVLMNGSVHIDLAVLTPSQRLLRSPLKDLFVRLSRYAIFRAQFARILSRPVPEEELRALWALLRHEDGHLRLPAIMGYVEERWRFRHRWIGSLTRLTVPTLVCWGAEDPVAVLAIARALAEEIPTAELVTMSGVGHYPQLEAPELLLGHLASFWRRVER